jgi:2-polyprenyl-3-methyl-5-hydroxy-6-metoxy-1,4-benzoquinol methylase
LEPGWPKDRNAVRLFDSWAADYAAHYFDSSPASHFFSTRLAHVSALLDLPEGSNVLDVGCGPGMMIEPLTSRGIEFFGTDLSEKMIGACKKRVVHLDACHLAVSRIQQLPFRERSFDAVLCMGVLEYIQDDELAVRQIRRVLKPNGILILSLLNKISPYRLWENMGFAIRRRTRPEKMFTERYCRTLLQANGFEIVDLLYFDFNLLLRPLDQLYPRWSVRISQRLESLRRSSLKWLGTAFLVKARRT